jgi:ribosomal protein S18 acetylase RimI-like enzyme
MKTDMNVKFIIRPCLHDDLPAVLLLMMQLNEFSHNEQNLFQENLEKHFLEMEKHPAIYQNVVLDRKGTILGFMSLIYYRSFFHKAGSAQINELIVDEKARGQGIGKQLVDYAMQEARSRGMDEIEVGTEGTNKKAIGFYRKAGFDEEYVLLGKEF